MKDLLAKLPFLELLHIPPTPQLFCGQIVKRSLSRHANMRHSHKGGRSEKNHLLCLLVAPPLCSAILDTNLLPLLTLTLMDVPTLNMGPRKRQKPHTPLLDLPHCSLASTFSSFFSVAKAKRAPLLWRARPQSGSTKEPFAGPAVPPPSSLCPPFLSAAGTPLCASCQRNQSS